jgi:hypothetical protein
MCKSDNLRYPASSVIIAIGRFGIVLLVGLSYPLQLLPCRASLHGLTTGMVKKLQEKRSRRSLRDDTREDDNDAAADSGISRVDTDAGESEFGDGGEEASLLSRNERNERELGPQYGVGGKAKRPAGEMTRKKFVGVTMGILICGFTVALLVDELEIGMWMISPPCTYKDTPFLDWLPLDLTGTLLVSVSWRLILCSPWVCRLDRLDYHLVHPAWFLLL